MSVRQRKNGSWMVHVVFKHPDGRKEEVRRVAPRYMQTRRGAEEYQRQLIAAISAGTFGAYKKEEKPAAPTLREFANERWMPGDVAATNRQATRSEKERELKLHILPQLGDKPLDEIGAEEVATFGAYLAELGLSAKTRKNYLGTLRRLLQCAVEWEVIPRMPRFPKVKSPDAKWDFFTREETDKLLSVVTDPFDHALLLFAFRTGARSGEQIAFTWGDIDHHNGFVIFRQAASRGVVGPTKSGKERRVPLTPQLEDALRKAKHLRSDLVFCNDDGTPFSVWQLSRKLDRYCRKAGLRRIRRHDTRHSFASQAVMAGVPLPRVQEWLGHSSITMTMKYAHLAPAKRDGLLSAEGG